MICEKPAYFSQTCLLKNNSSIWDAIEIINVKVMLYYFLFSEIVVREDAYIALKYFSSDLLCHIVISRNSSTSRQRCRCSSDPRFSPHFWSFHLTLAVFAFSSRKWVCDNFAIFRSL